MGTSIPAILRWEPQGNALRNAGEGDVLLFRTVTRDQALQLGHVHPGSVPVNYPGEPESVLSLGIDDKTRPA
jgi:hypothetical protein